MMRLIREGRELSEVKQEVQQLAASQAGLTPAMFFLNPDTGDYLNINGDRSVSAASTIKIPVLLAFFEDVDAGKIRLDESLVMRKDLVATEAGSMQYQPIGTRFSALETVEYMITISDNTATNMLIDRLGGAEKLNQRFRGWGLKQIMIRNPLPDLEGTNTVSPQDMAALMLKLTDKTFLSSSSREQALAILRQTVTNTLLPQGLDEDAQIAHKTGDIGSVVGDIGLIEMPNGQHYVAAILVQRPHNDPRAQELIRKISKLTYQTFRYLQQSVPTNPTVPQD
ncbi:MAG: serine hydrolase [Acaryochloridaceae cyanobacterium CSU_3_4]|nr:serine hydrolase [Acaryochloridaceae cyanobacterium CSU_3_4]